MDKFFKISERGSSIRAEIVGGVTTFFAMAYIIFHIQQADKGDEQADTGGNGALKEAGDGRDDLAAQGADRDDQEQDTAEQHDGQGLLPGVPHVEANGKGKESVQSHAGSLGEGRVGQQGRQQAADGGADAGGQHDAVEEAIFFCAPAKIFGVLTNTICHITQTFQKRKEYTFLFW